MEHKTFIVLGGDGFCGWPLVLRLSAGGARVILVDNLSHRKIDLDQNSQSLTPIASLGTRIDRWKELSGNEIRWVNLDLAQDYERWCQLLNEVTPDAVIHLAEQRSAPFSMRSSETSRYTVNNNINATHNVLCGIARSGQDIHLIHIGTMGVYGYGAIPDSVIPEGYIQVQMDQKNVEIMHPAYPGSIYHLTKTQDALMFQFYAKNYQLRITDLHQGIIWGSQTAETKMHPDLLNRLDYDEAYGTVLNRFLIQAAAGRPMTVYGTGGQTRAFIHIENSMNCIGLAVENPPNRGDRVLIRNQMTECITVNDLALRIQKALPSSPTIDYVDNPRKELESNSLQVSNKQFLDLGLEPRYFKDDLIETMVQSNIRPYLDRCGLMDPVSQW